MTEICISLKITIHFCRILNNLAYFSDSVDVTSSNNTSGNKLLLGYDTYALQLQNIDTDKFKGQTFSVNLGSVEEAMQTKEEFEDALKTSEMIMQVLDNSTAAVQLPENFLATIEECRDDDTNPLQRLSYSVFLTDILFQGQNQSKFDIGSIIVSTRLRCAENITLTNPVILIFNTVEKLNNTDAENGNCAIWDPELGMSVL